MTLGLLLGAIAAGFVGTIAMPLSAQAAPASFQLQPFEYVGTAEECGGIAGTDTVTAEWDQTTGNPAPSIFLEKQGATANCAAAGVDIVTSLEGQPVSNLTELNFEYKDGGHCGAGAPRFNIVADGSVAFLGCTHGTQTSLGNGWTHVEFDQAQIQTALLLAGIGPTAPLDDLYVIFDEGTDTPTGGTIGVPGSVYLDNFSVNGQAVGSPTSPLTKDACKNGGWKDFNPAFKNQGDCVSYVATNGSNQQSVSLTSLASH